MFARRLAVRIGFDWLNEVRIGRVTGRAKRMTVRGKAGMVRLANPIRGVFPWHLVPIFFRSRLKLNLIAGLTGMMLATMMSLAAQPSGEFSGTLSVQYYNGGPVQTNVYDIEILSSPSKWNWILSSAKSTRKIFYDGNQTIWAVYFPRHGTNQSNNVELKVFSGPRPFSTGEEEFVWMAFFSRDALLNKKLPLADPGLCIEEPCIFTKLIQSPQNGRAHV